MHPLPNQQPNLQHEKPVLYRAPCANAVLPKLTSEKRLSATVGG